MYMYGRMRDEGIQLYYNYLPELITDLSGQYSNYTTVQPCFDSLLYQMQHINQTVIGLPPNLEVCLLSRLQSSTCLRCLHTPFTNTEENEMCNRIDRPA